MSGIDWLPALCYLALIAAYVALCYIAPSAWHVAGGFAAGVLSSWCLDWKRDRALSAMRKESA